MQVNQIFLELTDKEAEQAVLGSMMTDSNVIPRVEVLLSRNESVFFTTDHQLIYASILSVFNRIGNADPILVANELNREEKLNRAGGADYLYELQAPIVETESTEFYAEILLEKSTRRQMIAASSQIRNLATDESLTIDEVISQAQDIIFDIDSSKTDNDFEHLPIPLRRNIQSIENVEANSNVLGLSTGFYDFDEITKGLFPGNLIIIAARPSMGKTSLALNIAQNVGTRQKKPVAVFSLEMSTDEISMRMLSAETEINFDRLRGKKFPDEQWEHIAKCTVRLNNSPIFLRYHPSVNAQSLRAQARRLKIEHPDLALIVFDYIQQVEDTSKKYTNREQIISEITRTLKILAGELNIPIIACSQLNREVTHRPNKIPQMSDLRDSGAIEQLADIVAFLHREDYYDTDDNTDDRVEANLIIKKHRNGRPGTITLYFNKAQMRFENIYR